MRATALLLLAALSPSAGMSLATPRFSVCTGSVCVRHGAQLVLEASQALACDGHTEVKETTCQNICERQVVVGVAGKKVVLGPCAADARRALELAFGEMEAGGLSPSAELLSAFSQKLAGDAALANGDMTAAEVGFSAALACAPAGFLQKERAAAAAELTAADPPPDLTGLTPVRLKTALRAEITRTEPGRVRWLYGALLGRCEARLAGADTAAARSDAIDATTLCPLAPRGWELLAAAADAGGDTALAAEARARAARLTPAGFADAVAVRAPTPAEAVPRTTKNSRLRAGLAYCFAITSLLGAVAFRHENPVQ